MNKQLHARKRRQFKLLSKQLNRLLQGKHTQVSKGKIEAIILKIKHLLRELSGIIARWEMKKTLGAAAVIFGLATASVQGQSFAEPVADAFGLSFSEYVLLVSPILADLDADGDLDVLAGVYYYGYLEGTGNLTYYENTGTVSEPVFGAAQPFPFGLNMETAFNAILVGSADLDADGDIDLLVTTYNNYNTTNYPSTTIRYYENTGTASEPMFTEQITPPGIDALEENFYVMPVFSDLDSDGDFDLVAGRNNSVAGEMNGRPFLYLENIGTASNPEFAAPITNPLGLVFSSSTEARPPLHAIADLDLDGDMDLLTTIIGYYNNEYIGGTFYFENTGTATNPQFVVSERNPLGITLPPDTPHGIMVPALGDLDDDGDIDMLGVTFIGSFYYYENVLGVNTTTPEADFSINISPNPTNDYLNINTDEPLTQIEIYDLLGKQLATYDGRQTQISIQDLSSGTYMIRLINQKGESLSKRIEKL